MRVLKILLWMQLPVPFNHCRYRLLLCPAQVPPCLNSLLCDLLAYFPYRRARDLVNIYFSQFVVILGVRTICPALRSKLSLRCQSKVKVYERKNGTATSRKVSLLDKNIPKSFPRAWPWGRCLKCNYKCYLENIDTQLLKMVFKTLYELASTSFSNSSFLASMSLKYCSLSTPQIPPGSGGSMLSPFALCVLSPPVSVFCHSALVGARLSPRPWCGRGSSPPNPHYIPWNCIVF